MADQPDPPDKWRVYEEDKTPDPEPPAEQPQVPYSDPPRVPYGNAQPTYNPVFVTSSSTSFAPKLILIIVAFAVLGGVIAGAVAIFAAVDGGIDAIGGIDSQDPEDFAQMVDEVEEQTGSTDVFWVGLYDGYVIVDVPYSDKQGDNREVSYRWDGGGLEKWNQSTSTDTRFDLAEIDPAVIDGMCDPVVDQAEGATPSDCYVFIADPGPDSKIWFRTSVSDEFGRSYWVNYDKNGVEVDRGHS